MQNDPAQIAATEALAQKLERELMNVYGSPLLTGEKLAEAMGYRSIHALRKHITQQKFPIDLFTIPGRKGRFALIRDIAMWLASHRLGHQQIKEDISIKN